MRADEPIRFRMYGTGMSGLADYINQLRADRLMRGKKIAELEAEIERLKTKIKYGYFPTAAINHGQCLRIAEALEARARRIKEGIYD